MPDAVVSTGSTLTGISASNTLPAATASSLSNLFSSLLGVFQNATSTNAVPDLRLDATVNGKDLPVTTSNFSTLTTDKLSLVSIGPQTPAPSLPTPDASSESPLDTLAHQAATAPLQSRILPTLPSAHTGTEQLVRIPTESQAEHQPAIDPESIATLKQPDPIEWVAHQAGSATKPSGPSAKPRKLSPKAETNETVVQFTKDATPPLTLTSSVPASQATVNEMPANASLVATAGVSLASPQSLQSPARNAKNVPAFVQEDLDETPVKGLPETGDLTFEKSNASAPSLPEVTVAAQPVLREQPEPAASPSALKEAASDRSDVTPNDESLSKGAPDPSILPTKESSQPANASDVLNLSSMITPVTEQSTPEIPAPVLTVAPAAHAVSTEPPITTTPAKAEVPVQVNLQLPIGHERWTEALNSRVIWQVSEQVQQAHVHLNPPELGPVGVNVEISDGQAKVHFQAQHPIARDAIQEALPKLREMFSHAGLNLTDANVSHWSSGQGQPSQSGHPRPEFLWNEDNAGNNLPTAAPLSLPTRQSDGFIDAYI